MRGVIVCDIVFIARATPTQHPHSTLSARVLSRCAPLLSIKYITLATIIIYNYIETKQKSDCKLYIILNK